MVSRISARSVICVVLLAFTTACNTTRSISASAVATGDKVEIERKNGSHVRFKVTEVSPDGFGGHDVFVPRTDIAQVQVVEQLQPAVVALVVLLGAAALYMTLEGDDCGDSAWQESCPYE